MADVYAFVGENMHLAAMQARFKVGSVEVSCVPPFLPASCACILPGVLVTVELLPHASPGAQGMQTACQPFLDDSGPSLRRRHDPTAPLHIGWIALPAIDTGPKSTIMEPRGTPSMLMSDLREGRANASTDSQTTVAHRDRMDDLRGHPIRRSTQGSFAHWERVECTVHFKFIPVNLSSAAIRDMFDLGGEVRKVRVAKAFPDDDYQFAFVEYASAGEAHSAIKALNHFSVAGYRICASQAGSLIRGGSICDADETISTSTYGRLKDHEDEAYIVNETRIRNRGKQAAAVLPTLQTAPRVIVGQATPELPTQPAKTKAPQVAILQNLREMCSGFVAEPTEAAFFSAVHQLLAREQQLLGPCAYAFLPALLERHQVILLHVALLLHNARGTFAEDAVAVGASMQSIAALRRLEPLALVEAHGDALCVLMQHHIALGMLFEESSSHMHAGIPNQCFDYAHRMSVALFGKDSVAAVETTRIAAMAECGDRLALLTLMPGVSSFSGLILQGSVTLSFW
jgi:hypothetical protein